MDLKLLNYILGPYEVIKYYLGRFHCDKYLCCFTTLLSHGILMCVHIYTHIFRERERERCMYYQYHNKDNVPKKQNII